MFTSYISKCVGFLSEGLDMAVTKPRAVKADPAMSAKWDELTEGREFAQADAPALTRLCSWYLIAERCLDDMTAPGGGVQVAYAVGNGISELPQVGTLSKAEAAIRGIEKSLGIYGAREERDDDEDEDDVLTLVQGRGPAARRFAG